MGEPLQTERATADPLSAPVVLICEYRDADGTPCHTPARYKKPGRQFCQKHYLRLYKASKLPLDTSPHTLASGLKGAAALRAAKEKLENAAEEYADLHLLGTRCAAIKGNTAPAEWALTHTRAIAPIEKGDNGPRISVQVGIALPGLGMSAQASESKALPAITVTMGEAQPQLEAESASVSTPKS